MIANVFFVFSVFCVSVFYFILWAVVSAGYPALLSCSYFERINDDDDDNTAIYSVVARCLRPLIVVAAKC